MRTRVRARKGVVPGVFKRGGKGDLLASLSYRLARAILQLLEFRIFHHALRFRIFHHARGDFPYRRQSAGKSAFGPARPGAGPPCCLRPCAPQALAGLVVRAADARWTLAPAPRGRGRRRAGLGSGLDSVLAAGGAAAGLGGGYR